MIDNVDILNDINGLCLYPALLATSFLHCRNVVTEETAAAPKLVRAARRRNKRAPVTFKTLVIRPITTRLSQHGAESKDEGLKKALHVCRGHFAEFGPKYKHGDGRDKGLLFGKYEGRFFIPQTLKGSSKHGAVIKDYDERVK